MSALENIIKEMIASDGPLTIDRYMTLCLAHPRHGYYMARLPFGRHGDFITAPEVSQIFGELIGVWCLAAWELMGRPDPVRLVELGPGRGTLMADLLRACRIAPAFAAAARIHLVEFSPALAGLQRQTLAGAAGRIAWHERLEEVPPGPMILIANEFFDAIPIRQLQLTGGRWHERVVGLDATGNLVLGLAPDPVADDFAPAFARHAGEGTIAEIAPERCHLAAAIGARLAASPSLALIIDYGHPASAAGDTLQAVARHRRSDPLDHPGEADITAHVDFSSLGKCLRQAGAAVYALIDQAGFLAAMGLAARVAALERSQPPAIRAEIAEGAARLAAADQMGHLFKVLGAGHPDLPPPFPFTLGEP
jgi:NADH dehydrogenase [ubiquinone] 1 alpha subcomplex assembly factor 7